MGIIDGKLLYCHGVAEGNLDSKFSTLEYNNRTFYDWFKNPFTDDFGRPALNLPPITFDDRPRPHKRAQYKPGLLPAAIYVAYEDYVSTSTTPSVFPYLLPSDDPNILHVMKKGVSLLWRMKIGYCCRKHDQKTFHRKTRFYCSTYSDKSKTFYYCRGFSRIDSETRNCFLEHQHYISQFSVYCFFVYLPSFNLPVEKHLFFFLPVPLIPTCTGMTIIQKIIIA